MQTLFHGFVHFNIHKAITYCQVDEIFLILPMAFWYMEKIMMDQTVLIIISI